MVVLHNDEHLPFSFVLDKASYGATLELLAVTRGKPVLEITPSSGTIPAGSQVQKAGGRDWQSASIMFFQICTASPSFTIDALGGSYACWSDEATDSRS